MELTKTRSRPRLLAAAAGVTLAALVGVFLLGLAVGDSGEHTREGDTFSTTVVTISADGDSICIDREQDSCGTPIVKGGDLSAVQPGTEVTVTEVWLSDGDASSLAFYVR